MKRSTFLLTFTVLVGAIVCSAKEPPAQVIVWPSSGTPVVRFSFGKFKELSAVGNLHNYLIDTTAVNLWSKVITSAVFNLYLFDKTRARIGEGWISLTNVGVAGTVKFQTTISASGTPRFFGGGTAIPAT